MSLGLKIRELRERKGLSQEQLADEIGVKKSSVSLWELDKTSPRPKLIIELAKYFEVDVDYLYTINSPKLDESQEIRGLKEALGDISSKLYKEQEKNKVLRKEIFNLKKKLEDMGVKWTGTE